MNKQCGVAEPMPSVLIAGASFAGLATAFWMHAQGFRVTVVEIADGLRKGGTPVDIRGRTVGIAARMGILDDIKSHCLPIRPTWFKNADDATVAALEPQGEAGDASEHGFEIERDALLDILFNKVSNDVEMLFGQSVTALHDDGAAVHVTFADGAQRQFGLVIGCDGNHSSIRRLSFGKECEYSHFLGLYFAIAIIDKLVVQENTTQIFNAPDRAVMLNSYEDKTDLVFCFRAEATGSYDHRAADRHRQMIREAFGSMGWKVPMLLQELENADNFYFDAMSQIRMPAWSRGRVVLVGDAACCASPAAGMGGSLAIIGAAALAEAFARHPGDFQAAFQEYERRLRPFVTEVQADAVDFGLETFVPATEEAIRERNARLQVQAL